LKISGKINVEVIFKKEKKIEYFPKLIGFWVNLVGVKKHPIIRYHPDEIKV